MRVAIHQPNYAPWSGYFAKMFASDVFIFLDDVQMPGSGSYVNRVMVAEGRGGARWLTIPVTKSISSSIQDVGLADPRFAAKHLSTLRHAYSRATNRDEVLSLLVPIYERASGSLASFNIDLIQTVARYLGWDGTFALSSDRPSGLKADRRLADLVSWVGGDVYVSGPGGDNYQSAQTYHERGLELEVRTYYPIEYARSGWDWVPNLSCLDVLFHRGAGAREIMGYLGCGEEGVGYEAPQVPRDRA